MTYAGQRRCCAPLTMTWCLLPVLPRSTGGGRWPQALHRAQVAGIGCGAGEVQAGRRARGRASSTCRQCRAPASFRSRRRLQHVIPEPEPSSRGRNSQRIPVSGTNRIPPGTLRSSRRLRPRWLWLHGTTGSSSSIRAHRPSWTCQPVPDGARLLGPRSVARDLMQLSGARPGPELRQLAGRFGVVP